MILLKNPSIEPIRHSEQSEESHVFPDLRPFTEFILRKRRVQGDNQRPFLSRIRTIVYVDGFNLYYGAVKDTPYKWLDLGKMCKFLLPPNDIQRLKYFTARVTARAGRSKPYPPFPP